MSEPTCPLDEDMPAAWCAHCRKLALPKPPPLEWFPARFDGRCVECSKPIKVGDDIAPTDDGYICRRRHEPYI